MIIDQSALTGLDAYLTPPPAVPAPTVTPGGTATSVSVNLSGPNPVTGRSVRLGPGDTIQVSGIHLLIEADDLEPLFARQSSKLLSVRVNKEMFPLLIDDPYANRVHNIAGFDDFQRGRGDHIRVLDVGGIPTLVSAGTGTSTWSSVVYQMPHAVRFAAAAWHLDASRNVPSDAFAYTLVLDLWEEGRDVSQTASETINLATALHPPDRRLARITQSKAAAAYQIHFEADVQHDSFARERLSGTTDPESLGRPLLQAINLLEPVEPLHEFRSLHELLLCCSEHELHWVPGAPLRRMTAMLDISATLTGPDIQGHPDESIELTVDSNVFSYVEARLEANVLIRPPRA